jgi:UDP-glucose 4-epimerase
MQTAPQACLVLGGEGFLGTNLCRRLISSGRRVRAFGRRGQFSAALDGVELRHGDLADTRQLADAVKGNDVVFHLIHSTLPQSANLKISADVTENLLPSLALLDLAYQAGVKRVVFVSSGGTIYGRPARIPTDEMAPTDPITAYGISKLAMEKYLALYRRLYGLDYRILRVANPFGPFQLPFKRQGLIAEAISCALANEPIEIWGDGSVVRDFIFVDDVVDALILAAHAGGEERTFNIGSGVGRSVREVLAAVEQTIGTRLHVTWKTARAVDVPVSTLSVVRARDQLGWQCKTSFSRGIAQTIAWWRGNAEFIKGIMPAALPAQ